MPMFDLHIEVDDEDQFARVVATVVPVMSGHHALRSAESQAVVVNGRPAGFWSTTFPCPICGAAAWSEGMRMGGRRLCRWHHDELAEIQDRAMEEDY